jgi:hypothetical protein
MKASKKYKDIREKLNKPKKQKPVEMRYEQLLYNLDTTNNSTKVSSGG